ncbi:DUF397 domain-containing protein [Embleya hyalina]|uniref:DUF397 domain-containing protein n=1 Tax=Embleya hyalina TaxID=516124 RepID=A0A401YIB3_9ACTN|nr:DUF397 domain-containing protein [Embleya hyalina]GCD94331.1 DUF397 domain-containing protein [Embleya hyalina]
MDKSELYEADLTAAVWIKASASDQNGTCVELAGVADGVAMRDSKNPDLPALRYTRDELAAFIAGAKAGEFDHLI